MKILFMQTADVTYRSLLEVTAQTVREYCARHGCEYESFFGITRGFHPWHAAYNRISLLKRLLDSGYSGWVCYLDADAYIVNLNFDLRDYLKDKANVALIIAPGGPSPHWWNINDGVFLINLAHPVGQAIVGSWSRGFDEITDEQLRAAAAWSQVTDDQNLLHQVLQDVPNAEQSTLVDKECPRLLNYHDGMFIRQVLRVVGSLEKRTALLRKQVEEVLCDQVVTPADASEPSNGHRTGRYSVSTNCFSKAPGPADSKSPPVHEDYYAAWAIGETSFWLGHCPDRQATYSRFESLSQSEHWLALLTVADGSVSVANKPSEPRSRFEVYRKYLESVVRKLCPTLRCKLLFESGDVHQLNEPIPIFSFQKAQGSRLILLPDVDFFVFNFYDGVTEIRDNIPFEEKSCSAVFAGSTTGSGGKLTAKIAAEYGLPRLRSAAFFRDKPSVTFDLTNLVEYDTEETKRILEEAGFGGKPLPWEEQFSHKFLISMDGNGATCSRVVIALKSNCVLLKYESPHSLYYFPSLQPWVHYIPIHTDDDVLWVIEAERRQPGLFKHIAKAGSEFAETYLTESGTMEYTASVLKLYDSCFSDRSPVSTPRPPRASIEDASTDAPPQEGPLARVMVHMAGAGDAPATAEPGADDSAPLVFVCEGHFENLGDDRATGGEWLGRAGSNRPVEGFMLRGVPAGVSYQAISQDGTATDPAHDGEFCGTRGLHQPVYGFRINLDGDVAARLECHSFATFVDGSKVGPVPDGHNCQADTLAPLESMRIELRSRRMRDRPATLSVSAFPDPQPRQHEAQVPRREEEPHPAAAAAGVLRRMTIDGFVRVSPLRGTPYLNFLKELHVTRQVSRYLEIGTNSGNSLGLATGRAVAIDPGFQLDKAAWAAKPGINLFEMTSDDFFATTDPRDALGGTVELAFIDGMHLAEFVLRDFSNVERFCTRDSLIVLHDALPQNFEMTERDNHPTQRQDKAFFGAWTGDVWRVVPLLRRERPDLRIDVLDCHPTGLVLVGNLDPQNQTLPNRLDQLTRELTDCDPPEAEFWSYIESLAVIDSSALPRQAAG
jgi:Glycosyl transferase family 90/Methyltransferase domain